MYPLFVNMKNKKVVIAGGGKIAYRRLLALLKEEADITVISPTAIDEIVQLANERKIIWHQRPIEHTDYKDAFLIIAATNDPEVNKQIAQDASPHQLVNVASDHESGNVHIPSFFSRGKLTIAVTTEGASPSLAKAIKEKLEEIFDESYEDYVSFLYEQRKKLKEMDLPEKEKKKKLSELLHQFIEKEL
ncbi:precorrin-2 dehydrogenase [Thermolongibacillus altinsuensis]|jgi:precorrin-2 dehydrogenase/sirohydrochlorin ferrochelatase|uniref:precorrin-2 dehydrogenase n=1 Tax=Thermolongibacillus altinsuensis TaxID=575256 RepID=A0A4R1QFB4_9BACL|nr:NAD(P)-binding protein [Thermolongibacillus altinsuensis]TCL46808.1 precorrin-2 dehydrogenase [Thermolongibacillus altinsuensis]GMB09259.1 precorrin-2 dehydrogenase [Thermolongibacillus altinsuensis]